MGEQRGSGGFEATLTEVTTGTAGRYVLRELIGRGATGEVWRAEDPEIGRDVAVKLLHLPAGLPDDERLEWEHRFLQEARAAGGLSHPGVVSIHDVGRTGGGRPYIVMELVPGRSLDAIVKEGAPAPAMALEWCAQVADALEAAHRHGIVHRDIKPANIIIGADQRARVLDFGIARLATSDLTRTGLFLGSPAYASPEQLQGRPVDGRSDIFSLGATLYALLTGVRPFQGNDLPELVYSICHREPAPLGGRVIGLPLEAGVIVSRALSKDPARRFGSARELSVALRGITGEAGTSPGGAMEGAVTTGRVATAIRRGAMTAAGAAATAASRLWRWGSFHWRRGWEQGPRARLTMTAGALIAVLLIAWGGVLAHQKLTQRQTPAQKLKKAFTSLFSE